MAEPLYKSDIVKVENRTAMTTLEDDDNILVHDTSESKIKKITKENLKEDLGINDVYTQTEIDDLLADKQDKSIVVDGESTTVEEVIQALSDDKANVEQEDWIEPTLLNGWASTASGVRYSKNSLNQVTLDFYAIAGTIAPYTTILTLPSSHSAPSACVLSLKNQSSGAISHMYFSSTLTIPPSETFISGVAYAGQVVFYTGV